MSKFRSIPEELIKIKAHQFGEKRQLEGRDGTPESAREEAIKYLKKHQWEVFLWRLRKTLSSSDYIAICALIVSVVGIPLSSWLSYQSANKAFLFQECERQVAATIIAQEDLKEVVTLFGRLIKTVAENKFGIDFSKQDAINKFNAKRHQIYKEVYSYGIVNEIKTAMKTVNATKLVDSLKQTNQDAYESYTTLSLHLNNIELSNSDKIYSIYRTFYEHHVLDSLAKLDKEVIRRNCSLYL